MGRSGVRGAEALEVALVVAYVECVDMAQLVPGSRSHLPRRLPGRQGGGWAGRQPPGRRRRLLRISEDVALGGGVQGPPSEAPAGIGPAMG